MTDVYVLDYSDKSFVVHGNTKPYKEQLKELGGRFNSNLKKDDLQIVGWIFPNKKRQDVEKFLSSLSDLSSPSKDEKNNSEVESEQEYDINKLKIVETWLKEMTVNERAVFVSAIITKAFKT